MKKRIFSIALTAVLALPLALAGCGDGKRGIDETKTQLYVGVYDGGLGTDSVYSLAKRFEEKYAEHSFQAGKTGVEVIVTPSAYSNTMADTIADLEEEVFIGTAASANYLAKKGLLADISDVYNKPLNYDFVTGETDPSQPDINPKDKIRSDLKYYYLNDEDNKYYGFPGATSFYGLVYDIELFEEENLYFAKDGGFVKSVSDARSAGPDGKLETEYDNGLPATFDEFFELCDKIVSLDMTPVMWGGTVQEYMSSLLTAIAADNDGKEQTELNYNYEGVADTLVASLNGDTPVLGAAETINARNGYKLYRQEGRYYALKFLERLVSKPEYYNASDATNTAFAHTDAQDVYLTSKYSKSRKRTAMLVEGNWWEAEARGTFLDMAAEHGDKDSMEQRRFGMLPLPKATADKVGEPYTFLERCVGDGFVNGNIEEYKRDLAKSFVQFMFTDESCLEYLQINSICMPINFDLGDAYSTLTPWGKNMYDLTQNAVTATMYSKSRIMQNYSTELWYSPNLWLSKIGGSTYTYPSFAMINNGVSAKDYFNGLQNYWSEDAWLKKFTDI